MSPDLLLSVVEQDDKSRALDDSSLVDRLYDSAVADRLAILAQLTATERHVLPGTTFSNPRERKDYPSEDKAAMTLAEFEQWLAVEVSERYHRDRHRGLGATPLSVWERAVGAGAPQALPADPRRFRLSFLPLEYRTLQRGGVQLNNIHYW